MNYFNYFTEIEDTFIRRRGRHLLLSPMDWALIESWKEMGVPLHVALRGVERAFDSFDAKPRRRTVKSLLYCQEEVEAQFSEWQEAQVGSQAAEETNGADGKANDAKLPFPRSVILEHLERVREALEGICRERKRKRADDFCDALARSASRLQELRDDFSRTGRPNAEKLEDSLTALEKLLDEALLKAIAPDELLRARAEAGEQLKPYRGKMETAVFEQTLENLLLKRLRDVHGLPRLSLFYL